MNATRLATRREKKLGISVWRRYFAETMLVATVFSSIVLSHATGIARGTWRIPPVCRSGLDRFFVSDGPGHDVAIDLPRGAAVQTEEVIFRFRRDDFVPLPGQHVECGLCADDLAGRRDKRRIAHVFANPRNLVQHFLHAVQRVLFGQLCSQVRQHAAGDLRGQDLRIDTGEIALELTVLASDRSEVLCDRQECREVESCVVRGVL